MASEASRPHIYRLDDTTWSYVPSQEGEVPVNKFEEIRFIFPKMGHGEDAYKLVRSFIQVFEQNPVALTRNQLQKGFNVKIKPQDRESEEKWTVSYHRFSCISKRIFNTGVNKIKQLIPFLRTMKKRKVAVVDVQRCKECLPSKIWSTCFKTTTFSSIEDPSPPTLLPIGLQPIKIPEMRMQALSFRDPFSLLSTHAFKTVEKFFTIETAHRGSHRFVLKEESNVALEEDQIPSEVADLDRYKKENQAVIRAYVDFLLTEFGPEFVSQIELSYGINFKTMFEQGLPLYPDHVAKCNIGANSIEIGHVEQLWQTLQSMLSYLCPKNARPPTKLLERMNHDTALQILTFWAQERRCPMRVLRGILRSIPHEKPIPTVFDLYHHLTNMIGASPPSSVRSLPPPIFNLVVDMIMPTDEERKKAFTGRRIRHLTVMGYHTMGQQSIPNPVRDMFELLHIYDDCRKTEDWKNYFELISHVVVKKNIFRDTPSSTTKPQQVHVGLLIPAPSTHTREKRWFFNESFFDDSQGNVNYVLLPACDGYASAEGRPIPMIKAYRSTASGGSAENGHDSVAADLNPNGSPGSLNPDISFKYERKHFEERTIPLWMGYLILALRNKRWERENRSGKGSQAESLHICYLDNLREATRHCKRDLRRFHPETDTALLSKYLEEEQYEELEAKLIEYGELFKETPQYKIQQDIACVGHSLGGALSQAGTYYFSTHLNRIPLPGNQFICYSSDGPAIDTAKDSEFMRFGRHNHKLFELLHIGWKVYHQFEYGDFVPEAGESHLGTTCYNQQKDKTWLDFSSVVFRPLPGSEALSIVTPPTHGRRIGTAVAERDYTVTKISPRDLSNYDHSYWLSQRIKKIWGYRFFNSPKLSEWIRRKSGLLLRPTMRLIDYFQGEGIGLRDENGVLAVSYAAPPQKSS
jgi:hypothetical protein